MDVHTLNNPSAHPSYSHYYLLSPSTLFFFSFRFFAHLLFCTSHCFALFISLHIVFLFLVFNHIYALVLCYFYIIFYSFALSTERT